MNPLLIFSLGAIPWASAAISPPTQATEFAIVHARIEVGNGETIADGTVHVRGGRIVAIGDTVSLDPSVKTIDGKGKTLYPGFIDAYSTSGTKSPPDPKTDGKPDTSFSAPPAMWVGNRKGISPEFKASTNLDLDPEEEQYQSGITTVVVFPARGSIRGTGAVVNLLPAASKTRVLIPTLGMGFSFRNGSGAGYPNDVLGVNALLRQTLTDAQSMSRGTVFAPGADKKPFWLASIEALQPVVTGQLPGVFDVALEREILRGIKISEDFGFKLMIAGGRDAYRVATTLVQKNIPVLLSVDFGIEPSVTPDDDKTPVSSQTPVEVKRERNDKWKEQIEGIRTLEKTGVKVALSSGGSPKEFLENVRKLIKLGWSKSEALKSLTSGAAAILGLQNQVGTLEKGKMANLVLMSGDFDGDKSKVTSVWVEGNAVFTAKEEKK